MSWQVPLLFAGLVGACINAGAFFAFSNFVISALADLPEAEGARAMQQINRAAPNPLFIATIVGAGVVAIPVLVDRPDPIVVVAVALSMASFLVTMLGNVPRNDRLERDASYWPEFVVSWTRFNTLRTLTSLVSAVAFGAAL